MRHKVAGWKLGRNTSHRRSLLRNLVTSLIVEERIETTVPKAKAMRPLVEKMITLGKRGDLSARRQAIAYLMTSAAVDKLLRAVFERRVRHILGAFNGYFVKVFIRNAHFLPRGGQMAHMSNARHDPIDVGCIRHIA